MISTYGDVQDLLLRMKNVETLLAVILDHSKDAGRIAAAFIDRGGVTPDTERRRVAQLEEQDKERRDRIVADLNSGAMSPQEGISRLAMSGPPGNIKGRRVSDVFGIDRIGPTGEKW